MKPKIKRIMAMKQIINFTLSPYFIASLSLSIVHPVYKTSPPLTNLTFLGKTSETKIH